MERRCFWPPESLAPLSPTRVSYPSGQLRDEPVGVGRPGRGYHLPVGGGPAAQAQVFPDGPV